MNLAQAVDAENPTDLMLSPASGGHFKAAMELTLRLSAKRAFDWRRAPALAPVPGLRSGCIAARVLRLLAGPRDRSMDLEQLFGALKDVRRNTLKQTLWEMKEAGLIARSGEWRAYRYHPLRNV